MSIDNFKLAHQERTYTLTYNEINCSVETFVHENKEIITQIPIDGMLKKQEKKKIRQEITEYFNNEILNK